MSTSIAAGGVIEQEGRYLLIQEANNLRSHKFAPIDIVMEGEA